jgi:hypothetical protein
VDWLPTLLQQVCEMEVLERVIKKANTDLTERNAELFKINQMLKEKHDKIKDRNKVLIRENMKLYRQLIILRLKLKEFQSQAQEKTGLESLANLATTMVDTPKPSTKPVEVHRFHERGLPHPKKLQQQKIFKVSIFANFEVFSKLKFRWFRRTGRLFINL